MADEGILVEVKTDQVSIQRRIAPQAKLGDQDFYAANSYSSAMVTTPPFSKIGKRTAYIRNGDGAIASIGVEVTNPLSNPQITSILPRSAYKDKTNGCNQDYYHRRSGTEYNRSNGMVYLYSSCRRCAVDH